MTKTLTESTVEEAALQWLGELGFAGKHGPEVAPGELHAERTGFRLRRTSADKSARLGGGQQERCFDKLSMTTREK